MPPNTKLAYTIGEDDECILPRDTNANSIVISAMIVLGLALVIYLSLSGQIRTLLLPRTNDWMDYILRPSFIWAGMGMVLLTFRTLLWFGYRPFAACTMKTAPRLTVIIPAYNEGLMVEKTIDSVCAARYPHDRLEIFVIDDGSTDDTWDYIQLASKRYPNIVTPIKFSHNQGKRAGLDAGFRLATGEVIVTIDSDSIIEADTLLEVTGPFRDAKVGAVAGRVSVYNRHQNIFPRMLHVRFVLAFDFLRAVQSTYRTVYCCPGALAAYRTEVVQAVNDKWLNQKFFGTACTYGEDRAMTNYILAEGYDTVYQRTAVVHTIVPWTYNRLCKMLLRWDRSYIREEIRFAWIVWKRPLVPRIIAIFDSIVTNMRYPMTYAIMFLMVYVIANDPMTIVRLLIVIGVMSTLTMLYFLRTERSWEIVYGVLYSYFSFFALTWIFPYALVTVRAKSWLTR